MGDSNLEIWKAGIDYAKRCKGTSGCMSDMLVSRTRSRQSVRCSRFQPQASASVVKPWRYFLLQTKDRRRDPLKDSPGTVMVSRADCPSLRE